MVARAEIYSPNRENSHPPLLPYRIDFAGAPDSFVEIDILGLSPHTRQIFTDLGVTRISDIAHWQREIQERGPSHQARDLLGDVQRKMKDFNETLYEKKIRRRRKVDKDSPIIIRAAVLMPFLSYGLSWSDIETMKTLRKKHGENEGSLQEFVHENVISLAEMASRGELPDLTGEAIRKWMHVKEKYTSADIYVIFGEDPASEIQRLHHDQKLNRRQIAKLKNVSESWLAATARKLGLQLREMDIQEELLERSPLIREVLGDNPREELIRLHHHENFSLEAIARVKGTKSQTISDWMKALGVKRVRAGKIPTRMLDLFGDNPKEELLRLLTEEKLVPAQIARLKDIKHGTVSNLMKATGIEVLWGERRALHVLGEDPKAELARLHHTEGNSIKKIAGSIGVDPDTISKLIKRFNVEITSSRIYQLLGEDPKSALTALLEELGTQKAVADSLGVVPSVIHNWRKELGIPLNKNVS